MSYAPLFSLLIIRPQFLLGDEHAEPVVACVEYQARVRGLAMTRQCYAPSRMQILLTHTTHRAPHTFSIEYQQYFFYKIQENVARAYVYTVRNHFEFFLRPIRVHQSDAQTAVQKATVAWIDTQSQVPRWIRENIARAVSMSTLIFIQESKRQHPGPSTSDSVDRALRNV